MAKRSTIPAGQRLKQYLVGRGLTQRELAAQLGVTDAHISSIIRGTETPGLALAVKIETLAGIPARDFARVA